MTSNNLVWIVVGVALLCGCPPPCHALQAAYQPPDTLVVDEAWQPTDPKETVLREGNTVVFGAGVQTAYIWDCGSLAASTTFRNVTEGGTDLSIENVCNFREYGTDKVGTFTLDAVQLAMTPGNTPSVTCNSQWRENWMATRNQFSTLDLWEGDQKLNSTMIQVRWDGNYTTVDNRQQFFLMVGGINSPSVPAGHKIYCGPGVEQRPSSNAFKTISTSYLYAAIAVLVVSSCILF
eukprot:GHVT01058670.1.p1 GENE.GHVT01058670.1~~GHVT01058670.1.p1  ORF type:complete len:235 (+),score=14.52 GHVT01058670.1:204-908(+)